MSEHDGYLPHEFKPPWFSPHADLCSICWASVEKGRHTNKNDYADTAEKEKAT